MTEIGCNGDIMQLCEYVMAGIYNFTECIKSRHFQIRISNRLAGILLLM